MGTTIRSEISVNSDYWLPKHRYLELKHFCLQYPSLVEACSVLDGMGHMRSTWPGIRDKKTNPLYSYVAECAEAREFYFDRINIIKQAAIDTDSTLARYILKGVTEGLSYEILKLNSNIPCCRDTYYVLYRRFFWLLSQARDNIERKPYVK